MKISKKYRLLAFAIALIAVGIGVYQSLKYKSETLKIKNDPMQAVAQVTQLTTDSKSRKIQLVYAFAVGSSTYFEKTDYKPSTEKTDSLLNKYFPVVYSKEDPSFNQLLITEDDFKNFDIDQPDSLKIHNALIKH